MDILDLAFVESILPQLPSLKSKLDWSIADVINFLGLLQVQNILADTIKNYEIDGAKLFDWDDLVEGV